MVFGIIQTMPASFNPLNRGGVIHTRGSCPQPLFYDPSFNPLNRGGVIHTFYGQLLHTLIVILVSILLIEAG